MILYAIIYYPILVLSGATGPLSMETELAALSSNLSLRDSNFDIDPSTVEFEMTQKHAQKQCGRFGKKIQKNHY